MVQSSGNVREFRSPVEVYPERAARLSRVMIVVLTACALPAILRSQSSVRTVSVREPCTGCRISLTQVATIGDSVGPGSLASAAASIASNSKGEYLVVASGPPQLFGSSGRFLRTIGRPGQGPREFSQPNRVAVSSTDSIIVSERTTFTVLGPDGSFARKRIGISIHPLWQGQWNRGPESGTIGPPGR
jgi:hypothetical protein